MPSSYYHVSSSYSETYGDLQVFVIAILPILCRFLFAEAYYAIEPNVT